MTAADTNSIRINSALRLQIMKAVDSIKERGIPKYESVPKFVERACIDLLNEEGVKS